MIRLDYYNDCDTDNFLYSQGWKQSAWFDACWDRTEPLVFEETAENGLGEIKVKYSSITPRCAFEIQDVTDAQLQAYSAIRAHDHIYLTNLETGEMIEIKNVEFTWLIQDPTGCLNIGRFVFEVGKITFTGCCCNKIINP